jgi:hypothetical protein
MISNALRGVPAALSRSVAARTSYLLEPAGAFKIRQPSFLCFRSSSVPRYLSAAAEEQMTQGINQNRRLSVSEQANFLACENLLTHRLKAINFHHRRLIYLGEPQGLVYKIYFYPVGNRAPVTSENIVRVTPDQIRQQCVSADLHDYNVDDEAEEGPMLRLSFSTFRPDIDDMLTKLESVLTGLANCEVDNPPVQT